MGTILSRDESFDRSVRFVSFKNDQKNYQKIRFVLYRLKFDRFVSIDRFFIDRFISFHYIKYRFKTVEIEPNEMKRSILPFMSFQGFDIFGTIFSIILKNRSKLSSLW